MTPVSRAQYLQQMGIIAYVPRATASCVDGDNLPLSSSVGAKHLSPSSHSSVKLLFLVQSAALDWSTPDLQFLKKIMTAVGLPDSLMAVSSSESLPNTLSELSADAKIVAFGSNLTVLLPKGSIVTLPLNELQQSDPAKRQLWQELKAIKAAYGY